MYRYSEYFIILFLGILRPCHCELVVVNLANGGTSRPMVLMPMGYDGPLNKLGKDPHTMPAPEALVWASSDPNEDAFIPENSSSFAAHNPENASPPTVHNTADSDVNITDNKPVLQPQRDTNFSHSSLPTNDSFEEIHTEQDLKTENLKHEASTTVREDSTGVLHINLDETTKDVSNDYVKDQDTEIPRRNAKSIPEELINTQSTTIPLGDTQEGNEADTIPVTNPTTTSTTVKPTSEQMPPTKTTSKSKNQTTVEIMKTTTPTSSTPGQLVPPSTTNDPPLVPACHQSCLAALNATKLYSNQSLVLGQGSDLTLICELPLDTTFIVENLIWLFHPDNSPTGQCSLTTQEFIHSCQGFQTIKNTDDRNTTFLRETLTLVNMLSNYTGQYMCQVLVTCCPEIQEHTMNQERTSQVTVQVWTESYTIDLVVAGSVAVVLLLVLLGVTYYRSRLEHDDYITLDDQIKEVKPSTVLHMPLIDDGDNDSFDSNFDEQD